MTKIILAALAASTVLAGAAFAAATPTTTTTHTATAVKPAPVTPMVPFKGAAASFKAGTDDKTATVSNKAGEWFTVSFSTACKPLDTAKTVTLAQTKTAGWLKSGKAKCKVTSFEKTASADMAPAAAAPAPAESPAPATTH